MHLPARRQFAFGPVQRLVAVFVIFVLLPGIVLGVFALRTLRQEKQLASQKIQQLLQNIAAQTGRELDREFRQFQEVVSSVAGSEAIESVSLPETIRPAVESSGEGVVVRLAGNDFQAYPPGQLLYLPPDISAPGITAKPLPPSVLRIENVELVQKDYPTAIRMYQEVIDAGGAELRPLLLQRLARSFRKAGRLDDAVRTYVELERTASPNAGPLPAQLVARAELCSIAAERGITDELAAHATAFYRDLVEGRWSLEKPRYLYYSDRCRSWAKEIPAASEEFRQLEMIDVKKLALTGAIEELLADPKGLLQAGASPYFAIRQRDPFAAIVLSRNFLESRWWPRVISAAEEEDLAAALLSPDGEVVLGAAADGTQSLVGMHKVAVADAQWRLQVWPRHPTALYEDQQQRQSVYMGMLIFVVALLAFGSYFTARIVRREFEIARMRADFVSTVSHEFRSPLTGIRQLGEMLLNGRVRGEEKQRRYFRMIVQESDRLGRLVENILDFSRMEEDRKEYRFTPLDPSVWLRGIVDDFQSEVAGNGVAITASIPDGLPQISADAEALACAVHNLLDNAVKYSADSKSVWVNAAGENGCLTILVRDRGIGISEQDRKHIFDKFYRVDGLISQTVKGAGLGLSLVKHIVTAHGGTVACESRMGEGSTFSIRLPAAASAEGG